MDGMVRLGWVGWWLWFPFFAATLLLGMELVEAWDVHLHLGAAYSICFYMERFRWIRYHDCISHQSSQVPIVKWSPLPQVNGLLDVGRVLGIIDLASFSSTLLYNFTVYLNPLERPIPCPGYLSTSLFASVILSLREQNDNLLSRERGSVPESSLLRCLPVWWCGIRE